MEDDPILRLDPRQNNGAISFVEGRAPLWAVVERVAAGEDVEGVAADFNVPVADLRRVLALIDLSPAEGAPVSEPGPDQSTRAMFSRTRERALARALDLAERAEMVASRTGLTVDRKAAEIGIIRALAETWEITARTIASLSP